MCLRLVGSHPEAGLGGRSAAVDRGRVEAEGCSDATGFRDLALRRDGSAGMDGCQVALFGSFSEAPGSRQSLSARRGSGSLMRADPSVSAWLARERPVPGGRSEGTHSGGGLFEGDLFKGDPRRCRRPLPLSILGRIEPTATGLCGAALLDGRPLSVSSVGSSPLQRPCLGNLQEKANDFQYPRSDRAHCNAWFAGLSTAMRRPFSILGRIEPTATNEEAVVLPADGMVTFSILGRIEPTATS